MTEFLASASVEVKQPAQQQQFEFEHLQRAAELTIFLQAGPLCD